MERRRKNFEGFAKKRRRSHKNRNGGDLYRSPCFIYGTAEYVRSFANAFSNCSFASGVIGLIIINFV